MCGKKSCAKYLLPLFVCWGAVSWMYCCRKKNKSTYDFAKNCEVKKSPLDIEPSSIKGLNGSAATNKLCITAHITKTIIGQEDQDEQASNNELEATRKKSTDVRADYDCGYNRQNADTVFNPKVAPVNFATSSEIRPSNTVRTVDERDHQIDDHQQQQMTERRLSFLKVPVNLSHRQRSIDSTSTVYMNNPHYVSRPNIENSVDSASTVYMDNHCVPKIRVNSANSVNSSTLYVENRVPMTFNGLEAISSTKIFHPVRNEPNRSKFTNEFNSYSSSSNSERAEQVPQVGRASSKRKIAEMKFSPAAKRACKKGFTDLTAIFVRNHQTFHSLEDGIILVMTKDETISFLSDPGNNLEDNLDESLMNRSISPLIDRNKPKLTKKITRTLSHKLEVGSNRVKKLFRSESVATSKVRETCRGTAGGGFLSIANITTKENVVPVISVEPFLQLPAWVTV